MRKMRFDRRRFLGFTAGAAAGTALGVPAAQTLSSWVAATEEPLYPPRGPEDFVLSVCNLCPGGCGIQVRRVGGRPVKVDGNPRHPVSGGRLCPRGQALLQALHHPDRLRTPLRRVGPRGTLASFEPASWDGAFDAIAEALTGLRAAGNPEGLALVRGGSRGLAARLADRFLSAFGSPRLLSTDRGADSAGEALHLTQGTWAEPAFDLQRADYVLSLGSSLLEAWSAPVYTQRAFGEFRQGRAGRRGKLVHAEPRLSLTGACADEWLAIRPGSEGILALGLAGALVSEDLYHRDFVHKHTAGFETHPSGQGAPSEGLRDLLERRYSLERAAAATGLSVNTILRLARELAAATAPLVVGPRRGPLLPGRLFDHLAAQTLNAVLGTIDQPGGVLVPEETPLPPWPALPADPLAEAGPSRPAPVEALLAAGGTDVGALLVVEADPAYTCAAPADFERALARVPLVVAIATLPSDTALLSDWILPASHALECWDLHTTPPGVPYPLVSLARPALDRPLHDSRPAGEILLELARRLGDPLAAALPWADLRSLAQAEAEGLFHARRGAVMGTPFDEAWVRMMERAGWWAPGFTSAAGLWQGMQETGGWWDPFYDHENWERVLKTASGRFALRPDLLAALEQEIDEDQTTPASGPATRLLRLHLFEPLAVAGGEGAELPFLQELLDPGLEEKWETWVEIHPETAGSLAVADGQWVRVASPRGSIALRARLTDRVEPWVAAIPVGLGHRGGGRWAAGQGANPLELLDAAPDVGRRARALSTTLVTVTPAGRDGSPRREA